MQERDAPAAGPAPRRLIDQLVARSAAALEGGVEIGHAVADVMDAGAAFRKELRHGTGRIGRLEQLDVHVAEAQADNLGTVRSFGRSGSKIEDVAVEGQRLADAGHCDADMRDRRFHKVKLTSIEGEWG